MNWLVAFHIIGVIVWMGGLSVLSRLLGYHADQESAEVRQAFKRFERRSYYWAILPGLLLSLGTGLIMLFLKGGGGIKHYVDPAGPWGATFHAKLTLVVVLIALDHVVLRKMGKLHREDEGRRSTFMALHGIVGLLFIVIVILVKTNLLG